MALKPSGSAQTAQLLDQWFPGEDVTQQFAWAAISALNGVDVPLNSTNLGAIIQTFARGDAFTDINKFKSDVLYHFTYERDPLKAREVGVINPNAESEINAKPGNSMSFSFNVSDGMTAKDLSQPRLGPKDYGYNRPPGSSPDGSPDGIPPSEDEIFTAPERGPTGVLQGGDLTRVHREGQEDMWLEIFTLPNGERIYWQYQDFIQVQDTYGRSPFGPHANMDYTEFSDSLNKNLFWAGEAGEITLLGGTNFTQYYDMVRTQALRAAGIMDPGMQGAILNDPEIANIIVRSAFTGSDINGVGVMGEIRATNYWRNVLYPGIDTFYGRNIANPEAAWRNYSNQISPGFRRLGFGADGDGAYKSHVANFLRAGVSSDEFNKFLPIAERIKNNPDLKRNLDAWAQIELGRNLNFDEFLSVLTRTSDPELDRVIESATLAFAAERAGVNISVADIRKIAEQTDLSEAAALMAFTEQDRAILAIGNQDLAGYGVSRGDILDAAVGATPRSGKSAAEIINLTGKLATERGISDDPTARFFQGLNFRGQVQRTGLKSLAQEGG